MTKQIAILGSTGSIGTQALEVIRKYPADFGVEVLTAQNNYRLLIEQALEFNPNAVVIGNPVYYSAVAEALQHKGIKVFAGEKAICEVVEMEGIDIVLTALVGFAGLQPTLASLKVGKPVALANKETLVVGGDMVTRLAKEKGVNIYPVDSEHSAIFQCLVGEFHNPVEKIILTASGGPFRGWSGEALANATREQALKHPNWTMGSKVTIDSASLMNKGLEVIEAHWLFGTEPEKIEVVIHPQSIIHSMVQFADGSIKAQLGLPDMKLPILYAFSFPYRVQTDFPRLSFLDYPVLTFEPPDQSSFRNLQLAYDAIKTGGNMPCILNASNEIAVEAFLKGKVGFLEMSGLIEHCMQLIPFIAQPGLDDYLCSDKEARILTRQLIK
ncbi:MAG: 1-deoxy-D-xylulose-5-phosphate reductoisomerase [Bacteroidetes bacterium]|nr:1-deoxy-D-xylulose-5-phosphate reductoisomerase [Bacteroidota bacterium]